MLCVCSALTWSVKRIVGVEDCGEEAEGEGADAERHVKARVPKTLESLYRRAAPTRRQRALANDENHRKRRDSLTPPLLSGSVLCP